MCLEVLRQGLSKINTPEKEKERYIYREDLFWYIKRVCRWNIIHKLTFLVLKWKHIFKNVNLPQSLHLYSWLRKRHLDKIKVSSLNRRSWIFNTLMYWTRIFFYPFHLLLPHSHTFFFSLYLVKCVCFL